MGGIGKKTQKWDTYPTLLAPKKAKQSFVYRADVVGRYANNGGGREFKKNEIYVILKGAEVECDGIYLQSQHFGGLKQEDCEFQASMGFIVRNNKTLYINHVNS